MANAYQDIITMQQQDNEAPAAFGHRVKTQCDLPNGLFDIQEAKDVFITGISDLVQAHVRVLNDKFPDQFSPRLLLPPRCTGTAPTSFACGSR